MQIINLSQIRCHWGAELGFKPRQPGSTQLVHLSTLHHSHGAAEQQSWFGFLWGSKKHGVEEEKRKKGEILFSTSRGQAGVRRVYLFSTFYFPYLTSPVDTLSCRNVHFAAPPSSHSCLYMLIYFLPSSPPQPHSSSLTGLVDAYSLFGSQLRHQFQKEAFCSNPPGIFKSQSPQFLYSPYLRASQRVV